MDMVGFLKKYFEAYRKNKSTDHIDGGVKKYTSGDDAPKVVESTEIISFVCEISLFSLCDLKEEISGRKYKMTAVLEDDAVMGKLDWHNRYNERETLVFAADVSFMEKLQNIVAKHDLAKHNGYLSHVSGLPDMYGASINISYASGEEISASDNQDNFLSVPAIEDLIDLFAKTAKDLQ
ncbi:MAG: hypothetical protein E7656_07540 [Ruminococcaceae bacterium]|nr:hypothetical protein [Oscillospiraceae bacterium]